MVIVKFNKTGTHIQHGFLKVRVDVYFNPGGKETRPVFCHFIKINPNMSLTNLEAEIEKILTHNVLASADAFLAENTKAGFHKFAKLMGDSNRLGNGLILPRGYDAKRLIKAANRKFTNLRGKLADGDSILDIKAGTITIGAAATGRASNVSVMTTVGVEGPADGTGEITSVEMWADNPLSDCEVATFIDKGSDVLSTRDTEAIGSVTSGSKQTFSGLNMDVQTGDYLGLYYSAGLLMADITGGSGIWYVTGDNIPCTDVTFTVAADYTISLYGTGGEVVVGGGQGSTNLAVAMGAI